MTPEDEQKWFKDLIAEKERNVALSAQVAELRLEVQKVRHELIMQEGRASLQQFLAESYREALLGLCSTSMHAKRPDIPSVGS